jgi:hypothetical protein
MAQVCVDELNDAELCVQENSGEACDCLAQPFRIAFPAALQDSFEEMSSNIGTGDTSSFCQDTEGDLCG